MIKIAICDDERKFLDAAEEMLKQYLNNNAIPAQTELFCIPMELIDAIEEGTRYDIYLLDIYMPGISGMSIATELRSRDIKSPVIFLTSSTDHALEAFGVDATHYLLKPYTKESFHVAMDKAMRSITSHQADSIVLKVDNEYRNIPVSKICYCKSEDKYQCIYCEHEKLLVRITAAELYKQLEQFGCFYRCGRGYIINISHLSKVTAGSAVFKDGTQLLLPHSAIAGLRSAFFDYFS